MYEVASPMKLNDIRERPTHIYAFSFYFPEPSCPCYSKTICESTGKLLSLWFVVKFLVNWAKCVVVKGLTKSLTCIVWAPAFMSNALYKDLMYFFASSCWGCKQGYSFQSLISLALQTGIWTFKQVLYSNSLQKVSRLTRVTRSRLTKFLIMNYKMHYFCAYNFFRTVNELPRKFIAKLRSMVWEDSTRDENLKGPFSRHF